MAGQKRKSKNSSRLDRGTPSMRSGSKLRCKEPPRRNAGVPNAGTTGTSQYVVTAATRTFSLNETESRALLKYLEGMGWIDRKDHETYVVITGLIRELREYVRYL